MANATLDVATPISRDTSLVSAPARPRTSAAGVQINSKLMQNYRLATPVTVTGKLVVTQDRSQDPALFSIGSDQSVYCFRMDTTSDTGWAQSAVGIQASAVSAGRDTDGNLVVFTTSGDNIIYVTENRADRTWNAPQQLPFPSSIGPLSHVEVRNATDGQLYLIAYYALASSTGEPPYGPVGIVWQGAATSPSNATELTHVDGPWVEVGNVAPSQFGYVEFLTPQVYTQNTTQYQSDNIYWDKGSGVKDNLAIWRPIPPSGYMAMGDYALGGENYQYWSPNGNPMPCVRGLSDPLNSPVVIATPEYWEVWNDKHTGAKEDGSIWAPYTTQGGYQYLGFVGQRGYDQPSAGLCALVRWDLVGKGDNYVNNGAMCPSSEEEGCNANNLYVNWKHKHGSQEIAIDYITPPSGTGSVNGHTFYAHTDWAQPTGLSYCLLGDTRQYTTALFVTNDPLNPRRLDRADMLLERYSVTTDSQNLLHIFGLNADLQLVYLDPTQFGHWVPITKNDDETTLTFHELAACRNAAGLLEVFLIGTDHFLYVARQNENGAEGWEPIAPLRADAQFVSLAVVRDRYDNPSLFLVSVDGELHQMFQDPATTTWTQMVIEQQRSGALEEIRTYSTEITVLDEVGVARPRADAWIWAEDETLATVNGKHVILDPQNRLFCLSNAAGQVTVIVETTSLYAPALKVTTAFLPEGSSVLVQPNAALQDSLEQQTTGDNGGQNLLNAKLQVPKDGVYPPLVEPPYNTQDNADAVAKAVSNLMALLPTTTNADSRECSYLARNHDLRGLHFIPKDDGTFTLPISVSPGRNGRWMRDAHWQLDFSSGQPVYRALTTAESVEAMLKAHEATLPGGIFDWFNDLGDLLEGIVDEVVTFVTVTVQTIGNAVQAAINFVVDGITYVFDLVFDLLNTTIEMIEKAFDVVACVFARIAVAFEDLFEWLGALFAWDDILRTHEVISWAFTQSMSFATDALSAVQTRVDNGMTAFFQQVDSAFDSFLSNVIGGTGQTLTAVQQSDVTPNPSAQSAVSNNIVYSGLVDNAGKAMQKTNHLATARREFLKDRAVDPIQTLIDAINTQGDEFQSASQAFQDAVNYITGMFDNPDKILESALGALFSVIKGVAEVGLAVAQALIDAVFEAVKAVVDGLNALLSEEWDIPLLSELYSFITNGSPLTALDLFSLVVAVPTTILCKLINGNVAPFPDAQSVADFKAGFTSGWLLEQSGLGPKSEVAAPEGWRDGIAVIFGAFYATSYLIYAPTEVVLDGWPPLNKIQPPALFSQCAVVMECFSWVGSIPWAISSTNSAGMGCQSADAFGNMAWLISILGPAMDTAMYIYSGKKNSSVGAILRNYNDASVVIDWIWAIFNFSMVVTYAVKEKGENKLGVAQSFMGAIPGLFKFCRIQKLAVQSKGVSLVILAILDGVGDISVALMQIAAITTLGAHADPA